MDESDKMRRVIALAHSGFTLYVRRAPLQVPRGARPALPVPTLSHPLFPTTDVCQTDSPPA
jgi:hypothetical protein